MSYTPKSVKLSCIVSYIDGGSDDVAKHHPESTLGCGIRRALGLSNLKSISSAEPSTRSSMRLNVIVGGNANNDNCSPRYVNSNNLASNTNNNIGGASRITENILNDREIIDHDDDSRYSGYFCSSTTKATVPAHRKCENSSSSQHDGGDTRQGINDWSSLGKSVLFREETDGFNCVDASFGIQANDSEGLLSGETRKTFVMPDIHIISKAMKNAFKGHSGKTEVQRMKRNFQMYARLILEDIISGSYVHKMKYQKFDRRNTNGKLRHILSPSLYTRILQHIFIVMMEPLYAQHDNGIGRNCKKNHGITARALENGVVRPIKHILYDRREYNYLLTIDQTKCYDHITPKIARKAMKRITNNQWLIDFGVIVSFVSEENGKKGVFPIGTPTSPLVHHICMLEYDLFLARLAGVTAIRYADDTIIFARTKEELQQIKWRIQQFWWHNLSMRAKTSTMVVQPASNPFQFCGYIFHRNPIDETKSPICQHNKGYVTIRSNTLHTFRKITKMSSIPAYQGVFGHADAYNEFMKGCSMLLNRTDKFDFAWKFMGADYCAEYVCKKLNEEIKSSIALKYDNKK